MRSSIQIGKRLTSPDRVPVYGTFCLQGVRVLFGTQGGVICNIQNGQEFPFGIEENVCVLDVWLPPNLTPGLGRQGRVTQLLKIRL